MPHVNPDIDASIRNTLSQIEAAEAAGQKELIGLIDDLRRQVVLAVAETGEINPYTADLIRQRIASVVDAFRERLAQSLSDNQRRLFVKGIQTIDRAVKSSSVFAAVPYLSEQTLTSAQRYGAELISEITNQARHKVNQQLELAVLGQKSAADVVGALGRNLDGPSVFGTVARRAEIIYRTEVNRIYNIAATERMDQLVKVVPDLQKQWRHSHLGVPRPGHVALDGMTVNASEPFLLVGKDGTPYEINGPHDPVLPPEESINCRCLAIPVIGRFYKPEVRSAA